MSIRTLVRDTVMQQLLARKSQASVRVKAFGVSPRFLMEQETKQANTYCVIVTDETVQGFTQRQRESSLTLKLVLYAYDATDPRAVLDAMIEDAYEIVMGITTQPALQGLVWNIKPDSITTDEATSAAGPWAQALCQWTVQHSRA